MTKSPVAAIEELVRSVAESAAQGRVKISERIEALRVLAPYYIALNKQRGRGDDTSAVTINGLQDAVRQLEESNGRALPDHQRRTGDDDTAET